MQIAAAASLEGKSFMDGSLVTFSGNGDYPYFIFLVDQAVLKGGTCNLTRKTGRFWSTMMPV